MPLSQLIIGSIGVLLQFVLVAILVARGHYRRMPLFTLYVGGVGVSNAFYGFHYTWDTWMLHQVVTAGLRFGVALELTRCLFGAFPAAAGTARRVMLVILLITAVTALATVTPSAVYTRAHAEWVPRLASAAIWMLTALAALLLWYRLPLAPLPRAILMWYPPYLLIFTIGMSLLFDAGLQSLRPWVGYVDTTAFQALILMWCVVAWRTAPEAPPIHRRPASASAVVQTS
jgi:hypothetical protein